MAIALLYRKDIVKVIEKSYNVKVPEKFLDKIPEKLKVKLKEGEIEKLEVKPKDEPNNEPVVESKKEQKEVKKPEKNGLTKSQTEQLEKKNFFTKPPKEKPKQPETYDNRRPPKSKTFIK